MTDPLTATLSFIVGDEDTAAALGSGSLPVLATPRLLAWAEATSVVAIEPLLRSGHTSVGTRVQVEHLAASAVGAQVVVTVTAVYTEPKLVRLSLVARVGARLVATGEITRVVVNEERFMARLA